MAWQIGWSLVLGFTLAAVIHAVVGKGTISRALPDARPVTLLKASGFGMASSSCSYAAAALARTLFRRGASLTASMVFQIASTNLVVELGIILWLLIGWRSTLAELVGGLVVIVVVAVFLDTHDVLLVDLLHVVLVSLLNLLGAGLLEARQLGVQWSLVSS